MHKFSNVAKIAVPRLLLTLSVVSLLALNTACSLFGARTKIQVPPLLPLTSADKNRLIQEVNRLSTLKSIHGKVDIEFEDTSFATVGIAEKYRQVDGTVTVQRPGKIYLIIQLVFVDIVQMASDGEHFAVAVLKGDDKYKRFVKGTNNAVYPKLSANGGEAAPKDNKQKGEKETVSALSNLRPQHLTEALVPRLIEPGDGVIFVQSEFFQEEPDTRPQAKKGARITRGYYLLEELSSKDGDTRLTRRFWFNRAIALGGIRLARVQTYDDKGLLVTDVGYSDERPFGSEASVSLPARIVITRPQDQYKLRITYQDPTSVDLNRDYKPEAFVLENKWQLPEVDLDAQQKKVTANR